MFLANPSDSAAAARIYDDDLDQLGYVMNTSRLWAWRPDLAKGFVDLRTALMATSSLSTRELAVLVCTTAATLEDSYCALAWGNRLAAAAGAEVAAAILQGNDSGALSARERALHAWARKVVRDPCGTTADDVGELRGAGLSQQEVFEATLFVALRLAFSTTNNALGARPDWQLARDVPAEVLGAVTYGRAVAERGAAAGDPATGPQA